MRTDLYTKMILTVIAIALLTIACNYFVKPVAVSAQGSLTGVQFFGFGTAIWAVDTHTGDIWAYAFDIDSGNPKPPEHVGKIVQLGKPLVK